LSGYIGSKNASLDHEPGGKPVIHQRDIIFLGGLMSRLICLYCRGNNLRKIGRAIAGYTRVQLYLCTTCGRLLTEGEVIKRPTCPKCQKPMKINNFGRRNRLTDFTIQFKCSRCGYSKTLGSYENIRRERSPRCPRCGSKNMTKKGNGVYECKKCGLKTGLPVINRMSKYIKEPDVKYVKLIKANPDELPRELREAIKTLDEHWIRKALKYTGPLPCPYCGNPAGYKGWKGPLRRYKCESCGREFTVKTYIRLAEKEKRPPCPNCGSNEHVIKDGKDYKGVQKYFCKKCGRYFRETTAYDTHGQYWEAAVEYVSEGISVKRLCREKRISPNKLLKSVEELARRADGVVYNERRKPGILIIDDSKVYINGRQDYFWEFLDYKSRLKTYADASRGRGWRDVARGIITYAANFDLKAVFSDGLTANARALYHLYAPKVVFVHWNRMPSKDFPLKTEHSLIIIDDFGDFAVVSLGRGRKLPLGRFKCRTNLDLAELILRFSDDLAVIVVNTKRNLSKIAELLLDDNSGGDYVYHFICGKGYLKALVERAIRDVKRRVSWFDGRFSSLENSRCFFKVNAFYYNMFHHHETFGMQAI